MNSGQWITYSLIGGLVAFVVWELVQLQRRRWGNKSARTLSQYVVGRAKAGSTKWKVFIVGFPVFIALVGVWLFFHFEGLCINWGLLCGLDV